MRGSLALLWLALLGTGAAAEVISDPPRVHGWWIGDVLVHRAVMIPPAGHRLDPATLPRPRQLAYWLDLRETTTAGTEVDGRPAVIVTTRWQTFYAPLEPSPREVPAYSVGFDGPEGGVTLEAPGWTFVTSPLRPILALNSPGAMAPDHALAPAPAARPLRATLGFALLTGLALTGLAWHQAWPPFQARPGRPFAAAARAVRRAGDVPAMALALHRGLDAARGAPLLAADLPDFLARTPEFGALADRLSAFFDRSAALFFGDARATPADRGLILDLARDLAAIERGRA